MPQGNARLPAAKLETSAPDAIARLITDHASDAIFLLDPEGRTTFVNPAGAEMFGWQPDELYGLKLHDVVHYRHPDGTPFPMEECPLGHVFETGRSLKMHEDVFYHRDGSEVPVACSNAAIIKDGVVEGGVLIVRDTSDRRAAERHKQLLLDELNHRVKNMLAVVQAIAEQSLKGPEYAPVREALAGRLRTLADAHTVLIEGDGFAASMHELVGRAMAPFAVQERISILGPDVTVPSKLATALSMALHELGTNAIKYGALCVERGSVSIQWTLADRDRGPELVLTWRESGGPPVKPPAGRGFGSRMIEKLLSRETGGSSSLEFAPDGLVATFAAPIA